MATKKAGVAEIARRAGVTTGAIYSRYSGKAELLVEAVDRHLLTQLHSLHSNASAVDVLSHLGDHLLDDLSDGTGLFLEAVAAKRDPELAERLRDVLQSEENKLRDLIHEAISQEGADSEIDHPRFDASSARNRIRNDPNKNNWTGTPLKRGLDQSYKLSN